MALIIYICLYWPGLVGPSMSRFGWNAVHFIGIILIIFINLYLRKRRETANIILLKHNLKVDHNTRFSEQDIKYLFILNLICVILSLYFIVIDIFGTLNIIDYSSIFSNFNYLNPYVVVQIITYFVCVIILLYTIKGVYLGVKKKLKNKFIFKLFFIIIIIILNFPGVLNNLNPMYWILIDSISLVYFLSYFMYVSMND